MFSLSEGAFPTVMDHPGVYDGSAGEFLEQLVAGGPTETSTNILDLDEIVGNVLRWKDAHPGLTPFYSPCVNNHPMVLTVLGKLGVGFSCASRNEMCTLLQMGVPAGRVWLAHPCKTPNAILCAQQNHVERIACDSVQEVAKVHRLYPTARIVLRIRVHPGQKFGCCPTVDLQEILNFARSARVQIVGVHVAIPQGVDQREEPWEVWLGRGLREAKATIECAHRMGLRELRELVLSGVDHVPPEALRSELTTLSLPPAVTFIIETDRGLVESAVTLVTNVQSKRVIRHGALSSHHIQEIMYFINDGRYGSFEWWKAIDKPPTVRRMNESGPSATIGGSQWPSSLWGPTCDSADIICERLELPELEVGDFLVFGAMGAYGATVASRFNGFPMPRTVACAKQTRTRELLDDNLAIVPTTTTTTTATTN